MKMEFNRFIMGRPNPITLPVIHVNLEKSQYFKFGANVEQLIRRLELWTYTDQFPPRIEVDIEYMSVTTGVQIGDVEKTLPHGVFLHKKYDHQKYHAIMKYDSNKIYKARLKGMQDKMKEIEKIREKIIERDAQPFHMQDFKKSTRQANRPNKAQSAKVMKANKGGNRFVTEEGEEIMV